MAIQETRHQRLEMLIEKYGTLKELARQCPGLSEGWLYQIRSGANMGDKVARQLEDGTGYPPGWMDATIDAIPESLADKWRRLSPDQQRAVEAIIDQFLQGK